MYNPVFKKIEYYLYSYEFIDMHIEDLRSDLSDFDYNQNYRKYIKNKSSSLEDQVIKNINLENKKMAKANYFRTKKVQAN